MTHDEKLAEESLMRHLDSLINDVQKYWEEHPEIGKVLESDERQ